MFSLEISETILRIFEKEFKKKNQNITNNLLIPKKKNKEKAK